MKVSAARIGLFTAFGALALFVLTAPLSVNFDQGDNALTGPHVGTRIAALATTHGAVRTDAGTQILAFLSVTCRFCQAAVPGLNILHRAPGMPPVTGVVFAQPGDPQVLAKNLHAQFRALYVPIKKLPFEISRKPDIVLLEHGRVKAEWYHAPAPEQVHSVMQPVRPPG